LREPFRPLRVTLRMRTPVALNYPWIFFDGLLAHLLWRMLEPEEYRALPSKVLDERLRAVLDLLPLERTGPVFHASASVFDTESRYVAYIYKRFCERYLDYERVKRKRLERGRGFFRDFRIGLVVVPARTVTFYAKGEASKIEELLHGLPALGKKRADGFGFVSGFEVEEVEEDWSLVRDGVAMRPLPVGMLAWRSDAVMMAYRPPYWSKRNITLCAPPGAQVRLRSELEART